MNTDKLYKFVLWLSVFGVFLSVYLLWQQFFHPAFQPCSINSTINCDAIITGPVSKTLGVPTPLIGLAGYVCLVIFSFVKRKKTVLSIASFGLLFCLWIGYKELFELHVLCPVCIACQATMISVFALAVYINRMR